MTAEELRKFVAAVRIEVDTILARLADIDPETLPPPVRAIYDKTRKQAEHLDALANEQMLEFLAAAYTQAGRELSPEELRGLLLHQ